MLPVNQELTEGAMVRVIITATEAKTAASNELSVGSRYSDDLATGTCTDQIKSCFSPPVRIKILFCDFRRQGIPVKFRSGPATVIPTPATRPGAVNQSHCPTKRDGKADG